jgi:drug/metabolite transporter (DMT)-like permease
MVFHQLVYTSMYYVLSFTILNTIAATGPLFVFVLDYFMNSVEINRKQFIGIVLGLMGVLLTINGDQIMKLINENYEIVSDFKNYKVTDIGLKLFCSFFLTLCNVGWAYSVMIQKRMVQVNGLKISFFIGI